MGGVEQKAQKRRLRAVIIGLVILGLLSLFVLGYMPRYRKGHKNEERASQNFAPTVRIQEAKALNAPLSIKLPSSTQANHITPIWARTNGYLQQLFVDIGSQVEEGQVLAILDTPDVDQQYEQAVADLALAKARRDIAKISADRWKELYKVNAEALSKQEVDEREAAYLSAEASVQAAEANKGRLKELMDFKYIIAPFTGVIIERNVDLGSLITQGSSGFPQELFKIAQVDIIRNYVNVPQFFFKDIHEGVEANVRIKEFGQKPFKGRVSRYAKALNPVARTLLTEVDIENKDGRIYPGLYAEVEFVLKPDKPYFIVPVAAIIVREGHPKIAVLDEQQVAHLRDVSISLDQGKTLEITEGLEPGERFIINPTDRIQEGVRVQIEGNHE